MSQKSSSSVKSEFTEILTSSTLIPSNLLNDEFTSILTETSLLSPPFHITDPRRLIETYDKTFDTPADYQKFIEQELKPWTNTIELKYFDTLYYSHRSIGETTRKLREQAHQLLVQADQLSEQRTKNRLKLEKHLTSLTRADLRKRLSKPVKIDSKPPYEPIKEVPRGTLTRPPFQKRVIRCYQCNSTEHIK